MPQRGNDVDRKAIKALVTLFGPREAARQAGLPEGTVTRWAAQFGWKKAIVADTRKDAGDMITDAVQNSKKVSTVHLARFVERAAVDAADETKTPKPLDVARQVKDVAAIYGTLWPHQKQAGIIEGAILIGGAVVTDSEKPVRGKEVTDESNDSLREELPDQGPPGD